jgi:hypothetical protein
VVDRPVVDLPVADPPVGMFGYVRVWFESVLLICFRPALGMPFVGSALFFDMFGFAFDML